MEVTLMGGRFLSLIESQNVSSRQEKNKTKIPALTKETKEKDIHSSQQLEQKLRDKMGGSTKLTYWGKNHGALKSGVTAPKSHSEHPVGLSHRTLQI